MYDPNSLFTDGGGHGGGGGGGGGGRVFPGAAGYYEREVQQYEGLSDHEWIDWQDVLACLANQEASIKVREVGRIHITYISNEPRGVRQGESESDTRLLVCIYHGYILR
jgi:hypothetical protein